MGCEIERKFLVRDDSWRRAAQSSTKLVQGYFVRGRAAVCRVRLAGDRAFLTIKGLRRGISRSEFEYPIPMTDAAAMLDEFCAGRVIDKVRYLVPYDGRIWEVDDYAGRNAGLVTAELELAAPDEVFAAPPWLGREVSLELRYANAALSRRPYDSWSEEERHADPAV